ncbi:MAG: hypothetical protein ABI361_01720 [Nitrososphaera sp.]|jgi:predicted DNA-binding transcriptional regulator
MTKNADSADSNEKRGQLEDILRGKTLMVYSYMIKRKEPIGVRELQRDLGFSSPSVATYHIEKLLGLSLVGQDEYGRYFVAQKVQVGVLQAFVNLGGFTFPRLTFFAAFFTTMLLAYIAFNLEHLDVYAVAFAVAGAGAFWYETVRVWTRRRIA